jgi:hypothetical protein
MISAFISFSQYGKEGHIEVEKKFPKLAALVIGKTVPSRDVLNDVFATKTLSSTLESNPSHKHFNTVSIPPG